MRQKISGIYKIQSLIKPDRIYIGSSVDINDRWTRHLFDLNHKEHHSIKLQRHFDKYGKNDLRFTILIGCDKDDLITTEQYFLDSYKTYFNTSKRAGSCIGVKHSEEVRKHMSEGQIRRGKHPEEHNRKMSEAMRGKYKGKKHSLESRQHMSEAHMGFKPTEVTLQRMRDAQKLRWANKSKINAINLN